MLSSLGAIKTGNLKTEAVLTPPALCLKWKSLEDGPSRDDDSSEDEAEQKIPKVFLSCGAQENEAG
jgi:hypothetical protein